jgi:hypothetical protein
MSDADAHTRVCPVPSALGEHFRGGGVNTVLTAS